MSPVIIIFGAGTGLGSSVARRFGREGFRVALVGRRRSRLDEVAAVLGEQGIEAASFPADLSRNEDIPAIVDAVRQRFGRVDVVEYGPVGVDQVFTPAAELDAATVSELSKLFLLAPIEVVQAVLPEMRERGDGAILITQGYSAVQPMPHMSGFGPVMAATRNYLYSLNGELEGTGVYAGTLSVAASIERSEMAQVMPAAEEGDSGFPTVDPDVLADLYWDMYAKRDRVEQVYPEALTPEPAFAIG